MRYDEKWFWQFFFGKKNLGNLANIQFTKLYKTTNLPKFMDILKYINLKKFKD